LAIGLSRAWSQERDETLKWAQQALADARRHRDAPMEAAALALLARSWARSGRASHALAAAGEAARLVDGLGDRDLTTRIDGLTLLSWAETMLERTGDGIRHAERGIRVARESGQGHLLWLCSSASATPCAGRGASTRRRSWPTNPSTPRSSPAAGRTWGGRSSSEARPR
jgi:hypothetical protein